MYIRLRNEVEKISGDVIRFTQNLVRIPSPSLHEKEVAGKVAELTKMLHDWRHSVEAQMPIRISRPVNSPTLQPSKGL